MKRMPRKKRLASVVPAVELEVEEGRGWHQARSRHDG
jgi:hypothetical protein